MSDLRYAIRLLRSKPVFTLGIVGTLTIGIGASTAIFSVLDTVMLKPLPFRDPDRLVWVAERNDKLNLPTFSASALNYLSWQEQQPRTLEALGGVRGLSFVLTGPSDPEQLTGAGVTSSLIPLLGVPPVRGRAFTDQEDRPGGEAVAMITEGLWRRDFGGEDTITARRIVLNGVSSQIVGVLPDAIGRLLGADVVVPIAIEPAQERRLNHVMTVMGRMRPGVTLDQAQAEMDAIARRDGVTYPEVKDWGIRLVTFARWIVGDQLRMSLVVLFGAVASLLLIACANVANLLLGRAATREQEMAVRAAIGASQGRLFRQLLIESLSLSVAGGVLGIALAVASVRLCNAELPQGLLPVPSIEINALALFFACGVTLVAGLLFGIVPAWSMARRPMHGVLKQASRSTVGGARAVLKRALVAAELALATMLLVGAGLLGQTLVRLQHVALGFEPDHLLTFQLSPPTGRYPLDGKAQLFYRSLIERLRAAPGVTEAAVSSGMPMGQGNYTRTPMAATSGGAVPVGTTIPIDWRIVSPDFFHLMRIPLLRGRTFTDADGPNGQDIVVVSRAMARSFWGDTDPVGRFIRRVGDGKELMVVGVVGDVRNNSLDTEIPSMYYASARRVWPLMDIVVRTPGDPGSVVASVRQAVRSIDSELPISTVRTEEDWVSASAAQPRLNAVLMTSFACAALLVAAIGVYSVLAYSVAQRTREMGVRLALGSSPGGVVRLILREGMTVGLLGVGTGVVGALALGRVLAELVYGVPVHDPTTFVVVSTTLTLVAFAACVVPARRASRVDPLTALRSD
jgi:putative ABC transport system permease protein